MLQFTKENLKKTLAGNKFFVDNLYLSFQVYQASLEPLLTTFLEGYNVSVLLYGAQVEKNKIAYISKPIQDCYLTQTTNPGHRQDPHHGRAGHRAGSW